MGCKQTYARVTEAFMKDFDGLLKKYGAEIEAKDYYQGYSECGEDVRMTVTIPAVYNDNHECIREFTEVDLGSWIASTK